MMWNSATMAGIGIGTNGCFFNQFCVVAKSGNDPREDLTKFRYMQNIKVKLLKHPSIIFCYPTWTIYRNLVIFLSGYWKSQKENDFSTFNF